MFDFAEEFIVQFNAMKGLAVNEVEDRPCSTNRFGGSSIDDVCSCFMRRSIMWSVMRRNFFNPSFRAFVVLPSVTESRSEATEQDRVGR